MDRQIHGGVIIENTYVPLQTVHRSRPVKHSIEGQLERIAVIGHCRKWSGNHANHCEAKVAGNPA